MKKTETGLMLPEIPEDISVKSFLDMSQFIINTCEVVYYDIRDFGHFVWREEGGIPFWLNVAGTSRKISAKRRRHVSPPIVTATHSQAFIRAEGIEFGVVAFEDMSSKEEERFLEDLDSVDAHAMMRDYCQTVHIPVDQSERVYKNTRFDELACSGIVTT